MARPRKPSNVLELKGSFDHNPSRRVERQNEPQPAADLGDPPLSLSKGEKECWYELVRYCHRGTLCSADALIIEHGARVLYALRLLPLYMDTKLMSRLEAVLGKLGLTPADRSKVQVIKPAENANPYAKFKTAG